jgi:hypothetical protein
MVIIFMMKEYYLQMAWKLAVLAGQSLQTFQGDSIEIIFPGYGPASIGGPDFSMAKIRLNHAIWTGSVEVHTQSSFWYHHKHHTDPKYDNVILHVVWENDTVIKRKNGEEIPCLELKHYLSLSWFDNIDQKLSSLRGIPCGDWIHSIEQVVWQSQLDVVMVERITRKVKEVEELYPLCHLNWDEVLHRLVARYMGRKINNECMQQLAISLPYKILLKHSDSIQDLEALLFGQGGFLDEARDEYALQLQQRYLFLRHKYGLQNVFNLREQWQYKGLRPSGFPEMRLAQWAYLLHKKGRLINWVVELSIPAWHLEYGGTSMYWTKYYRFGKKSRAVSKSVQHWDDALLINAFIPFRIAYKNNTEEVEQRNMLLDAYEQLIPEKNYITNLFRSLGYHAFSARDTQAMLELYNNYCNYKKCLSCKIGHVILKREGLL